jgi:AraC-like DNA-binding protein
LTPVVCGVFQTLGVSATLFDGRLWWPIHSAPSLLAFEVEYGVAEDRWKYNDRSFASVLRRKKPIVGEHAGLSDMFVPVLMDGKVTAILVVGSFAVARPTSADVLERWRKMTGRKGHPADPAFLAYLRAILSIPVLDGGKAKPFERLLVCLAMLLGGEGQAGELANEAHGLRREVEQARFVERVWEAARTMVDERFAQGHYSAGQAHDLRLLGLHRAADHVLVGLATRGAKNLGPVEEVMAGDAFQRSAVELVCAAGDAIAGRVGDHGVTVLSAVKGSAAAKKQKLLALGKELAALAKRRFGLTLHLGASLGKGERPLDALYQDALGAAELALTSGQSLVIADPAAPRPANSLRDLREELGRAIEERPESLPAKFERFLEVLSAHSSARIERARAELEMCLERVAETLLCSGSLDRKTFRAMRDGLDRAASAAGTTRELFEAYRRAVADLSEAMRSPVAARQGQSLRRALEYVHQHYAERLELTKVARVAGFAPAYLSELFRKREGIAFERYVLRLRIERAKHLLTGTDLDATRVAELSGLKTPQYLCRVFRNSLGVTPLEYRASLRPEWTRKLRRRQT